MDPLEGLSAELQSFIAEAPVIRRPHIEFLQRAARTLSSEHTILDVGSGLAPYRELFSHTSYTTCDWDQSLYSPEVPPDIVSPADEIPVEDQSFDAVLCTEVLEHVPAPWDVLSEFHRIVRPGGAVWITVPFTWPLHEQPHDYYRYTKFGLRHLLERAGFSEVDVAPLTDAFSTLSQLVHDLEWLMGKMDDGYDQQRGLIGDTMRHVAGLIASFSSFDTQWMLPIGYAASAVREVG
jgi:SAM-dependent methyltransferase